MRINEMQNWRLLGPSTMIFLTGLVPFIFTWLYSFCFVFWPYWIYQVLLYGPVTINTVRKLCSMIHRISQRLHRSFRSRSFGSYPHQEMCKCWNCSNWFISEYSVFLKIHLTCSLFLVMDTSQCLACAMLWPSLRFCIVRTHYIAWMLSFRQCS